MNKLNKIKLKPGVRALTASDQEMDWAYSTTQGTHMRL